MVNIFKKLLVIFITFSVGNAIAQTVYEDVVYLKNGSIIHGIITEQVPNESLKIQTKDKNVFVFRMDEIEKIAKEKKSPEKADKPPPPPVNPDTDEYTGYTFGLETHFGPGLGNNNSNQMSLATHVINGVMVKSFFSIGLGLGFEFLNESSTGNTNYNYDNYNHQFMLFTYYIDVRLLPLKGKITPMVILNYGYSGDMFSQAVNGGALMNGGLGAKFYLTRKLGMNLSLNYKRQQLHYDEDFFDYDMNRTPTKNWSTTLEYMCITFGVSF